MEKITFSIIAPIYNELDNIDLLYQRISEVMNSTQKTWELILVDDGSIDGSTENILALYDQHKEVKPVLFARNFGHQIAVTAGMDAAEGDAAVIIDADLQDPPEVILDMIAKWEEGYEVVYAVRKERKGESWFKLITASLFYKFIHKITNVNIPMNTGDFRLLDRKVLNIMNKMREKHRYLRGLGAWVGFRQIGVEFIREPRHAGVTKYPFKKMLAFALTAITGFSYIPLQFATILGFIVTMISLIAIPVVMILRLTGIQAFIGQATTLITVLFFGGVQLISLGIIGEYIGRIYDEVKGRPLYITRETPERKNLS